MGEDKVKMNQGVEKITFLKRDTTLVNAEVL